MTPEQNLLQAIFHKHRFPARDMVKHIAWDFGVFTSASRPQFVRTLCSLKSVFANIDNEHPTCERCIAKLMEKSLIVSRESSELSL